MADLITTTSPINIPYDSNVGRWEREGGTHNYAEYTYSIGNCLAFLFCMIATIHQEKK